MISNVESLPLAKPLGGLTAGRSLPCGQNRTFGLRLWEKHTSWDPLSGPKPPLLPTSSTDVSAFAHKENERVNYPQLRLVQKTRLVSVWA
jgi:hypothetical protein